MLLAILRSLKTPLVTTVVVSVPLFAALSLHIGGVALPAELDRADDPIRAGFRVTSPRNPTATPTAATCTVVASEEEILTTWTFTGRGIQPSPWQGGGSSTNTTYTGPTSAAVNKSVQLTCTVTGSNSSGPPGLTVTFYVDGASVGSTSLSGGSGPTSTASLSYTFTTKGQHSVYVKYNGDYNDAPSTSSTVTVNVG
jgi:hypothetical protein